MNDFESQWESISTAGHAAGRLRVYPDHLLDFFISFSLNGHREIVIEANGIKNDFGELPSFENLDVVLKDTAAGLSIGIVLIDHELAKSFAVMCFDIAERSKRGETIEAAAVIAFACLSDWADLLKRRGRQGLNRNEAIGLWGELSTLDALLGSTTENELQIVQGWRGPNGDQRDIGFNNTRIEVKTQLSTKSIGLKISSLDQLDDRGNHLNVVLYRISPSEAGISVAGLIEKVRLHLAFARLAQSEFERKVMLAAFDSDNECCNEKLGLDERIIYDISDSFPRLIPNNVPTGIKSAEYEITGTAIAGFQISWKHLMEKINE
jgi:hypothetical protein